jgi:cell division transport system ATP-binding protein
MLEIKNLTKSFGGSAVFEDLNLSVPEGEFIFITGPSGSGKTTLLRLILRDLVPDSGEIIFEGENIVKIPSKAIPKLRQKIGVIFQDFKVLPESKVKENVEVALAVLNLPQSEWAARVDHVLNLVGLEDKAELFPSQLSGGELQRVSMARALVVNPKVILADEPTGNLDWETADKIMELFEKISKEGKTIIMATHHKELVDKMKKRVIKLESKKKVTSDHEETKVSEKNNKK